MDAGSRAHNASFDESAFGRAEGWCSCGGLSTVALWPTTSPIWSCSCR